MDRYQGVLIHPQRWPEDLDVTGKRVIVIGSGATAATLIPAIARGCGARDDAAALPHLLLRPTTAERARRNAAQPGHPAGVDPRDPPPRLHRPGRPPREDGVRGPRRAARVLHRVDAAATARGLRHRQALHPPLPPMAAAHRRRPGGRLLRGAALGPGVDRHRHHRDVHRDRDPGQLRRADRAPTSSSPRPASPCRSSATSRSSWTASRSTSPTRHLARHHDQRRARTWPTSSATSATAGRCAPTWSATS